MKPHSRHSNHSENTVQVKAVEVIPLDTCELELELEAWDIASDEALYVFEEQFIE